MIDDRDDEQLLAALRDAMQVRLSVPDWFVAAAKDAYTWHDIDAELAQLSYDSSLDRGRLANVRSETASIRALTFTSAHLSIELEVTGDYLLGQIIPPRNGTIEAQTKAGPTTTVPVDEVGCFAIEPPPSGAFRLHCRTADGVDVITGWVTPLPAPTSRASALPAFTLPAFMLPRGRRRPPRPPAGPDLREPGS